MKKVEIVELDEKLNLMKFQENQSTGNDNMKFRNIQNGGSWRLHFGIHILLLLTNLFGINHFVYGVKNQNYAFHSPGEKSEVTVLRL